MKLLTERAEFLVECLDLPTAAQVEDAQWERFQIDHLNDDSVMRIEDKARQIAYSFVVSAEAVANAMLYGESTSFVSINQDEAAEKIRYANLVYENLNVGGLPRKVRDNVFGIEYDNKARIMSLPSRPPRGKAKMHVVFDEFAHVMYDEKIYVAGMYIIAKGGRLRIGSSPMGATGKHWEISTEELQPYPGFMRAQTPWWEVKAFCLNRELPGDVGHLSTEQRVERYGNDRIKMLFQNSALEDFQQEMECVYIDEVTSYFPWELIRANQDPGLQCWHLTNLSPLEQTLREMKAAIAAGEIENVLVGGMDIGRTRNLTELFFVGIGDGTPIRLMISLYNTRFDKQESCVRQVLQILPIHSILIDRNGIGMHLAENLDDTVCEGVDFTNATKAAWANELKIQMGRNRVPIPCDRDLAYQIHSIKQLITAAKNAVYDTERNEKHHADKMWALALAVWAGKQYQDRPQWGTGIPWQRR